MHLAIDIGNTTLKAAVFDGDEIVLTGRYKKQAQKWLRVWLQQYTITDVIISATDIVPQYIYSLLQPPIEIHSFDQRFGLPIHIKYSPSHTLGRDRVASSIGSRKYFEQGNNIIIDMGTCITTNVLSADNKYVGGNISPGIKMRLKAMHVFTHTLPKVDIEKPEFWIGESTSTALQNGGILGALYEIDQFINRCMYHFGDINVVLTGGDAQYFVDYTKNKIFVAPFLVLEGLNRALKYHLDKN